MLWVVSVDNAVCVSAEQLLKIVAGQRNSLAASVTHSQTKAMFVRSMKITVITRPTRAPALPSIIAESKIYHSVQLECKLLKEDSIFLPSI